MLEDGTRTSHSDLGFRIGAMVPIDVLPKTVAALLETRPHGPDSLYDAVAYWHRYFDEYGDYEEYEYEIE